MLPIFRKRPPSLTILSSPEAALHPAWLWVCCSLRCSSTAINPYATRPTFLLLPNCRHWRSSPTSIIWIPLLRSASAKNYFHEWPNHLKACVDSHVQIFFRSSRSSFRSKSRPAVSLPEAADQGGACVSAIRHCGTQGLRSPDRRGGNG